MKRKEVIKDKLIVLKSEADKIYATIEPSIVNTNNKIREYVSTICNHTEEEIYVSFSDSSSAKILSLSSPEAFSKVTSNCIILLS